MTARALASPLSGVGTTVRVLGRAEVLRPYGPRTLASVGGGPRWGAEPAELVSSGDLTWSDEGYGRRLRAVVVRTGDASEDGLRDDAKAPLARFQGAARDRVARRAAAHQDGEEKA